MLVWNIAMATHKARKDKSDVMEPKAPPSVFRWFMGHVFSALRRHGNVIVFWFGIGYCVRQASLALIAFAGKASLANIQLGLLANVSLVWTASVSISGASIVLYLRERRLHRQTIARLSPRAIEKELKLDPHRTSSH
jgi:hypothetical protein